MNILNSPIDMFIINSWDSFSNFSSHLNLFRDQFDSELIFSSEGFIEFIDEDTVLNEKVYLFNLTDHLYGSVIQDDGVKSHLVGIFEFNIELLKTDIIKELPKQASIDSNNTPQPYYHYLSTGIVVDCKSYDYQNEHKFLISQKGKIDLLYSQQLTQHGNFIDIQAKTFPSLKSAIEFQLRVEETHARVAQILAKKQKAST